MCTLWSNLEEFIQQTENTSMRAGVLNKLMEMWAKHDMNILFCHVLGPRHKLSLIDESECRSVEYLLMDSVHRASTAAWRQLTASKEKSVNATQFVEEKRRLNMTTQIDEIDIYSRERLQYH